MKRMITLLLVLMIIPDLSFAQEQPTGFDHFKNINSYQEGQFRDVSASAWYSRNVASVYALGLMKGIDEDTFGSEVNITLADTITLASRLHSMYYHDGQQFPSSVPWYQVYVDYALDKNIIRSGAPEYSHIATRAEFAMVIADSLPAEAFEPISLIDDGSIPDIPSAAVYYDAVYKLYRAGILTGSDAQGTFSPYGYMTRKEVAVIMARVADKALRKKATLTNNRLSLNYDYVYISENEKVKLFVHDENGKIITSGITWKTSGPESVEVKDGTIQALTSTFGREMITATTEQGTAVHCMAIYKSKEVITQIKEAKSVYIRYPSILSIENVYPDIALWFYNEISMPDLDIYNYYYTYQARTVEDAALYTMVYAEYLEQNGYKVIQGIETSSWIPELENYAICKLIDPSGKYQVTVNGKIAAAGDRFRHAIVDVSIEEAGK